MIPTSDWHIHSRNSCDAACLVVGELVNDASLAGLTDYGLTDHYHTPYNLPDIAALGIRNPPDKETFTMQVHTRLQQDLVSAQVLYT